MRVITRRDAAKVKSPSLSWMTSLLLFAFDLDSTDLRIKQALVP